MKVVLHSSSFFLLILSINNLCFLKSLNLASSARVSIILSPDFLVTVCAHCCVNRAGCFVLVFPWHSAGPPSKFLIDPFLQIFPSAWRIWWNLGKRKPFPSCRSTTSLMNSMHLLSFLSTSLNNNVLCSSLKRNAWNTSTVSYTHLRAHET